MSYACNEILHLFRICLNRFLVMRFPTCITDKNLRLFWLRNIVTVKVQGEFCKHWKVSLWSWNHTQLQTREWIWMETYLHAIPLPRLQQQGLPRPISIGCRFLRFINCECSFQKNLAYGNVLVHEESFFICLSKALLCLNGLIHYPGHQFMCPWDTLI